MSEKNIDLPAGGAGVDDPKPPAESGLDKDGVDVKGLQKNRDDILAEKKKLEKRLEAFELAEKQRQDDEAKKRGDYESLLKEKDEKLRIAESEKKRLRLGLESVQRHGVVDYDAVTLFIDKVSDDLSNLDEVIENERKVHPWIFKQEGQTVQTPTVPTDKSKIGSNPSLKVYTRKDVDAMSDADYEVHRAAIKEQINREGALK